MTPAAEPSLCKPPRRIVLLGPPCAGKTTIGQALAKELGGVPYVSASEVSFERYRALRAEMEKNAVTTTTEPGKIETKDSAPTTVDLPNCNQTAPAPLPTAVSEPPQLSAKNPENQKLSKSKVFAAKQLVLGQSGSKRVTECVLKRLRELSTAGCTGSEGLSFVLDGFPRTREQAVALDEFLKTINSNGNTVNLDLVLELDAVMPNEVERRAAERVVDAKTYAPVGV